MSRHPEIGRHLDPTRPIKFGPQRSGNRTRPDPRRPDDIARPHGFSAKVDLAGPDGRDAGVGEDFHAQSFELSPRTRREILRKRAQQPRTAFHQKDAGLTGIDVIEIPIQNGARQLRKAAGQIHPGRTAAHHHGRHQFPATAGIGHPLRLFIGQQEVAAQAHRIIQGLESRRVLLPVVVAEVTGTPSQGEDEVVERQLAIRQQHPFARGIDALHLRQNHIEVGLTTQDRPDGLRDVRSGQTGCRHLIQQRLKKMVVLPVDHRDAGPLGGKSPGKTQAAEAGAEHHNVRERRSILRHTGTLRSRAPKVKASLRIRDEVLAARGRLKSGGRIMSLEDLRREPVTDPLPLYRYRDGLVAVDLLGAAVAHLDLFTWLAAQPATLGAIAQQFELQLRPTDVMMTLFNAMGLTTPSGGVFHVTLRAREHLNAASPFNLAPYFATMKDRPQTKEMLQVLRTGRPAHFGSFDPQAWAEAMERPDFAAQFTAGMDCRGVLLGPALARQLDLSEHTAVLDVGGGSGIYACALVAHHPHLRATVLDRAPVDRIAREAIARQGASDQVDVVAADMFADAWPRGHDVHLLSNVIHDWGEPAVRDLLAKSHAALPTGGLLLVHDMHVNAEKTGPLHAAEFSALMMMITEGKCYSVGEMQRYLGDLGFEWAGHHPSAEGRSVIVARKP